MESEKTGISWDIPLTTMSTDSSLTSPSQLSSSDGLGIRREQLSMSSGTAERLGRDRKTTRRGFLSLANRTDEYRDSLSELRFKPLVFIKVLLLECTSFFGLPIALLTTSYTYVKNRGLLGLGPGPFFGSLMFVSIVGLNVLFFVFYDSVIEDISLIEIVIIDAAYIVRNTVIATKWAFTSDKDIERLHREPLDREKDIVEKHIISGWINPSKDNIKRQLNLAALQRGVHLQDIKVLYDAAHPEVAEAVLREAISSTNEGKDWECKEGNTFPAWYIPYQIMLDACARIPSGYFTKISLLLGFLHGITPIIVHLSTGHLYQNSHPSTFIIYIFIIWASTFNVGLNYAYMVGGCVDVYRRFVCLKSMLQLITIGYPAKKQEKIVLDMAVHQNVVAFIICRQVLQTCGMNYYLRIKWYTNYFLMVLAVIIGYMYFTLAVGEAVSLGVVVIFLIDVVVLSILLLATISFGNEVNLQKDLHIAALLKDKLSVESYLAEQESFLAPSQIASLRHSARLLETVADMIEVDDRNNQITVLGFTAGGALVKTLLSFAVSGIVVIFQFINTQSFELR